MYKTEMIKVYIPSFKLCIFSLIINLLVLGIQTPRAIAQNSESRPTEANTTQTGLETAILLEINRVRTNPQGYAQWLEEQRQYYDGIWLKLPGEKPIRTNKGLEALEEAIAFLKTQQPLSPLSISEQSSALANTQLENFVTANNIQNISYGRVTAKGIVMSLVVDELFPDRRRRNSLLNPDAENTAVVCQSDPSYAKVCAIAYADVAVEVSEAEPQATPETSESATTASQLETKENQTTPEPQVTPETSESATTASQPETKENQTTPEPQATQAKPLSNDTDTVAATLPQPQQPQAPPTPPAIPDVAQSTSKEESESADKQNVEIVEVFEAEEDNSEEQVSTNSDIPHLLENVERGSLEEGDNVIADDGSFYDSYPLEGKAGDSFTIYLESDEFDAFVALIDDKGNIIEQNDDISEENSNSRIRVTIPENGVYNVIVNAYDEGGQGKYVLIVSR